MVEILVTGKITRHEMERVVYSLYEMLGYDSRLVNLKINEIFYRFDLDRSNTLDKYEFINFMVTDPIIANLFHY